MGEARLPAFGRYEVTSLAGEGSLGRVYRARHAELGRDAAIKDLRAEVRTTPSAVSALRSEAVVLSQLHHPNIVALYDFVEEPHRTWLAEQWVDGVPLDELLAAHGRLVPEQALGVLTGALSGLAHAHRHDVVHRDIASSNVLAETTGTSMLVDFGLAAPVAGHDAVAAGSAPAGAVVGTPAFLSPEAARGESVGKAGDVYSAAALTYYLLTGRPLFEGSAWEVVGAHRDRTAPGLTDHGPRLQALLARSLSKDAAQRPPDAAAFLAELEEAATERYGADWRTRSSIAALVAGAGGAVVTVAGGGPATVAAEGLSTPLSSTAKATVRTGSRIGLKVALAAGATVAVVAAGATTWALTSNDEPSDDSPTGQNAANDEQRDGDKGDVADPDGADPADEGPGSSDSGLVPADLTLDRKPFCGAIDEGAVRAALGAGIDGTSREVPGDTYDIGDQTVTVQDFSCGFSGARYSEGDADFAVNLSRFVGFYVSGTPAKKSWLTSQNPPGCASSNVDAGALGPGAVGEQCVGNRDRAAKYQYVNVSYSTIVGDDGGFKCFGSLPKVEAGGFAQRLLTACAAVLERITR